MLASSPAVPTTTAVAAAALNYGDTAGFDEIVRLKHAEADAAATLSDCATQNATLRADLEETRRQLLLVVAQRDALHAALHETRARGGSGGGGGGGTAAAAAAAASAAAVEHKVAVEGYQKELALQREELVSVEQQRAVMSSQIGRLTEEVRSFGRALDATLRDLQVPSPPDSPPLDKLHLLAAAAAAMAQTVAEGEKAQRTLESRVAILSEKDREHTALIEGYQALQHKMAAEGAGGAAAAADLRPGAAAEQQQQQQLDASGGGGGGGKMRAGAPLSAAGQEARITALQAQLSKLRAENVALMEKEAVTQTGAGAGTPEAAASPAATSNSNAVLAALQMEITRLHGKLKGKKDTITSLKALIRKHVDATGGLGAGVAASRAGSPPATPPAAAHHRAAGGAGAAGLAGRATPPVGMVGGGGLPHSRGYSPVRQRAC